MTDLRKAAEKYIRPGTIVDIDVETTATLVDLLRQAIERTENDVLAERRAILETVEELTGMERDRHPMFAEGYDYALGHIEEFIKARGKK